MTDSLRFLRQAGNSLTYAPLGWRTELPSPNGRGYAFAGLAARERRERASLIRRIQDGTLPLVEPAGNDSDELLALSKHNLYMTYAYVLGLAMRRKQTLSILDYGGNVGDYYWIGKTFFPDIDFEYHCKELPAVAEEGGKMSPQVIWHADDSCLERQYDLVMFNSSLQYLERWKDILRRAAAAARTHLFLGDTPIVERVPTYAAIQSLHGASMLHQQLNKTELLGLLQARGLRLAREFFMGRLPPIENAPEQAVGLGLLFERGG